SFPTRRSSDLTSLTETSRDTSSSISCSVLGCSAVVPACTPAVTSARPVTSGCAMLDPPHPIAPTPLSPWLACAVEPGAGRGGRQSFAFGAASPRPLSSDCAERGDSFCTPAASSAPVVGPGTPLYAFCGEI